MVIRKQVQDQRQCWRGWLRRHADEFIAEIRHQDPEPLSHGAVVGFVAGAVAAVVLYMWVFA